jgi:hypothetical protein
LLLNILLVFITHRDSLPTQAFVLFDSARRDSLPAQAFVLFNFACGLRCSFPVLAVTACLSSIFSRREEGVPSRFQLPLDLASTIGSVVASIPTPVGASFSAERFLALLSLRVSSSCPARAASTFLDYCLRCSAGLVSGFIVLAIDFSLVLEPGSVLSLGQAQGLPVNEGIDLVPAACAQRLLICLCADCNILRCKFACVLLSDFGYS